MLRHLIIKNYALIRHFEMEPSAHLNVITGETGAGKSIMLGAIGLLTGNRADTKVLWDENEKCIIEGTFDIEEYGLKDLFLSEDLDYDAHTLIRREISPGGKSRAFINDTPVTLEVLRRIGGALMDIHSQHETLQLGNQSFQLRLVDTYAAHPSLLQSYKQAWSVYVDAKKAYEDLTQQAETLRQEADYVSFQLDELVKADLSENEQESLEAELKIMDHAEEIKSRFHTILQILNGSEYAATNALAEVKSQLMNFASFSPAYEALYQRFESVRLELDDIVQEIEKEESKIEFDPQRHELVKERLGTIYRLLKKHRVNEVKDLIALQNELQKKANITSNIDEELEKAKKAFDVARRELNTLAEKLTASRKKAFDPLCSQITVLLKELGIPNATLTVDHQAVEPSSTGSDKIDILFSANKGIAPRPLAQVASGGEFSRLMFCIKYVMAEKTAMPTLVLDEIDTGVSGEIAIKLGNMMSRMARKHQLITISHLPQVAAKGDAHYVVFKDNAGAKTISNIRRLNDSERVEEIAKMLGGASPSKVVLQSAKELLGSA